MTGEKPSGADAWTAARTEHPRAAVSEDGFAAVLRERVAAGTPLAELRAGDLYLTTGVCEGDAECVRIVETRCIAPLRPAIERVAPGHADDVLQNVRLQLFVHDPPDDPSLLAKYTGRGDLRGWVRVVATRLALSLVRRQEKVGTTEPLELHDDETLGLAGTDPELSFLHTQYGPQLRAALAAAAAELSADTRTLLRLYYQDGLTIDELGALRGSHRATASKAVKAARDELAARAREHLVRLLGADPREISSLLRVLRSQVHLSAGAIF